MMNKLAITFLAVALFACSALGVSRFMIEMWYPIVFEKTRRDTSEAMADTVAERFHEEALAKQAREQARELESR